jgi:hypothetical protein
MITLNLLSSLDGGLNFLSLPSMFNFLSAYYLMSFKFKSADFLDNLSELLSLDKEFDSSEFFICSSA